MGKSGALSKRAWVRYGACLPLAWLALAGMAYAQAPAAADPVKPFNDLINSNCVKCHNSTDWAGGVAMDTMDLGHAGEDPQVWEEAVTKLRGRLMPPAGEKQPTQPAVDAFVNYLETSLDASAEDKGVGHVPLERLTRTEFSASVKGT